RRKLIAAIAVPAYITLVVSASAAELMGQYCDGDADAFRRLYALVAPRVLAYLTNLIGERPAAEDLLQQTFLKLHQARAVHVRNADPVPWIYAIAHRTCLDELRRRKRSRVKLTAAGRFEEEPRAALSGSDENAEPVADEAALSSATLSALAKLPESQREALVLTKLHGRSHAEAAAIAGTTSAAIKLRAHRAYITLRQLLSREPS